MVTSLTREQASEAENVLVFAAHSSAGTTAARVFGLGGMGEPVGIAG